MELIAGRIVEEMRSEYLFLDEGSAGLRCVETEGSESSSSDPEGVKITLTHAGLPAVRLLCGRPNASESSSSDSKGVKISIMFGIIKEMRGE